MTISGRDRRRCCIAPRLGAMALPVGLVLLASCTFAGGSTPGSQEVEVDMRDHAYEFEDSLVPGRVLFRVANRGKVDHDLALVRLPDDVEDLDELLGSESGGMRPVYTMASRGPGETGVFAVDLSEGRYGMLCFETDPDGTPHYRNGMTAEFEVGQP